MIISRLRRFGVPYRKFKEGKLEPEVTMIVIPARGRSTISKGVVERPATEAKKT